MEKIKVGKAKAAAKAKVDAEALEAAAVKEVKAAKVSKAARGTRAGQPPPKAAAAEAEESITGIDGPPLFDDQVLIDLRKQIRRRIGHIAEDLLTSDQKLYQGPMMQNLK